MKKLIEQRYLIRHNFLTIIGFCLAFYFTYHIGFGERSLVRLLSLEQATERLTDEHDALRRQRVALEERVTRMRPGSIDRDLLEEQARAVLGYAYPDERIIIQTN